MKTKQTMIQSMIQSIQSAFALLFAMLFALQALPILAQAPVAAIPDQAQKSAVTTTVANVMLDTLKPSTVRYGAFAGFGVYSLSNIAELSSGIPQLLTSPILPYIQQGLPFSLRAGGLVELPFGEGWGFQGRLEISRLEAIMQSLEKVPSRVGSNKVETINVTHNLAAEIWSASLSALMVFRPLRFLSLMAGVDVHGAFSSTIKTSEKLNSNAVQFENRGTVRDERDTSLGFGIQPGFSVGASYEIPLNFEGTVLLAPEALYSFSTSPLREGVAQGLRGSLALRFAPGRTTPLTQTEIQERIEREQRRQEALLAAERKRQEEALEAERVRAQLALAVEKKRQDSLVQEQKRTQDSVYALQQAELNTLKKGIVTAKITSVSGVGSGGDSIPNPKLLVEEFLSTTSRFMWNRLVFEENSTSISSRYRRIAPANRGSFAPSNVMGEENGETLYYQILNIAGWYLTENPSEKLTLLASAAASETEPDKLANERAQAIQDYLELVWKIPRKRVSVERETASAPFERSVGLRVEKQDRLQWLSAEKTRRAVIPETIAIGLEVFAGSGLKQWNMEITQFENREVTSLHSATGTANVPASYRWNVGASQESMPRSGSELTIEFEAFDVENHQSDKQLMLIPVEYRSIESKQKSDSSTGIINDKRLDRYSFIVAVNDNGEVVIDPLVQAKIAELRPLVAEQGTVVLTGYDTRSDAIAQLVANGVARLLGTAQNLRVRSETKPRRNATSAVSAEEAIFGRFAVIEVLLPIVR